MDLNPFILLNLMNYLLISSFSSLENTNFVAKVQ